MAKKSDVSEKMMPLSRHNSIVMELVKRHGEEVMELNDTIAKLKRKPGAEPARETRRKKRK